MTSNSNERKGPGRHLIVVLFALAVGLGFTASAAFAALPSNGPGAASSNASVPAQGATATLTIGLPTETIGLATATTTVGLPTGTGTVGVPTGTSTVGLPTGTSTIGVPTGTMTAVATGTSTVMVTGTVVATATCGPSGGQTYTNPAPIVLSTVGPAVPYPAEIVVAGGPTSITDVNVTFHDVYHTWPDDVDMLLVGPGGENAIIWSDAGGSSDILTATIMLDDEASIVLPDSAQIVAGSYRPANYVTGDTFPAPAPAPSGGSALSVFDGTNANGTWSLYIVDDLTGFGGAINGGWSLTFNSVGTPCPTGTVVTTATRTSTVVASVTTTAGTATRTGTASVVPSLTVLPSLTVVPSLTVQPSVTRTASVVASMTVGTATRTVTIQPTITIQPTMTRTASVVPSMTVMPSMTVVPTMSRTASVMPSMTMTGTAAPTRTGTTTVMPSMTGTVAATRTTVPCNGRVTICHRTGNGNSHTISVSCNALPAHLRHGDTVGACPAATPRPRGNNFRDINSSEYFYEHVLDLRDVGAIGGYDDGTFRPYNQATRAQLVKIVVLAFEIPLYQGSAQQFTDVPTDHPFYQYIMTAWRDNIISGYNDGTFRPYNNVTRAQIAKIAVESARMEDLSTNTPSFTDVPTDHPFYRYIETAYANGILNGYADNTFRPYNDATRGQITKIVNLATHEDLSGR